MAVESSASGQLRDFLDVLSRRRWQVILPALFVLTLGTCFAVIVPKKYVVETKVEVRESRNPQDYRLKNPQETATVREVANAEQHIRNHRRIADVLDTQAAELGIWPEYETGTGEERTKIVRGILKDLEVELPAKDKESSQGSTFVEVTYRDEDVERGVVFLRDLIDHWLRDVVAEDVQTLVRESDVLQNDLQTAEEEYARAVETYSQLAQELAVDTTVLDQGAGGGPRQGDWVHTTLDERKTKRIEVTDELATALRERSDLRERYEDEPPERLQPKLVAGLNNEEERKQLYVKRRELERYLRGIKPANQHYERTKREIQEIEAEMGELEATHTGENVEMERVPNEEKLELKRQLDEADRRVRELEAQLTSLDEKIAEFERKHEARTLDIQTLATLRVARDLARDQRNKVKAEYLNKRQSLELMRDAYGQPYEIATPAQALDTPPEPNPWLITLFCLFAGLALGLSIALAAEYGRSSYRTVADLASVMAVPVLGAISPIVTAAEERRRRLQRTVIGASSAVILGGLAWFTWVWYAAPDLLPLSVVEAVDDFRRVLM